MRGWRGDISGKISEFACLHVCGMSWPIGRLKLPKAGKYDYIRESFRRLYVLKWIDTSTRSRSGKRGKIEVES